MSKGKIQLTTAEQGRRLNSHVRVYDAKTKVLKRVEMQEGNPLPTKVERSIYGGEFEDVG